MFREIESCIKRPSTLVESCRREDGHCYGIESYGISVTTLEEVFLRVAGCDFEESDHFGNNVAHSASKPVVSEAFNHCSQLKASNSKLFLGNYKEIFGVILSTLGRACQLIFATFFSLISFLSIQCCCVGIISKSTFWQHSRALFIKRAVSARRDRRTIVFQLLIPVIFLFFGLLFLKLKPHPDQQAVTLTTSYFNPLLRGDGGGGPIPFNLTFPISKKVLIFT